MIKKRNKRSATGGASAPQITTAPHILLPPRPMDDIEWIREEPPNEEPQPSSQEPQFSVPNEQLQSHVLNEQPQSHVADFVPSEAAPAPITEEEIVAEIPVTIEPKSTEVRFIPEPQLPTEDSEQESRPQQEDREGSVPVEIYDPKSTTVPAYEAVQVEVYDPNSTTVPSAVPIEVEHYDESVVEKPVVIDHTTPEIRDEAEQTRLATAQPQNEEVRAQEEPVQKLNEIPVQPKDSITPDRTANEVKPAQIVQNDVAAQPPPRYVFEDVHKTIEDINQLPPPPELPTGGLPRHVESVLIGEGVVNNVNGCIVLPNGTVMAADEEKGIILFDTQGNVVKKITNPAWRNPRSPIYYKEHILMLIDIEESGKSDWCRYIFKFTANLEFVAKIEGPKWMRNETVVSERLSIAHTDCMYLCIRGEIFSALYELTPVGRWTELQYRLSESYVDMLAFAVVGPITQILVVEGIKNYVLMFSVRDSEVVDRRRIAICERPGALARDEAGRLFVANRASASIQLVDTVRWTSARNVALADAMVPHFCASWGLLAIPLKGAIRLQRYSFRFGVSK